MLSTKTCPRRRRGRPAGALAAVLLAAVAGAWADGPRQVLPVTLVPEHYDVRITPDAAALALSGAVEITGNAPAGGRRIVLNAQGLVLDEARLDGGPAAAVTLDDRLGRATLDFAAPFGPGRHVLRIAYHGPIARGTSGFFAMDYDTPEGRRRTLATNLEPTDARRVLPCWDEPALKATFTVAIDAPADRMALSNMPVAAREILAPGLERVHFQPSPRMSTYLLFLGVGDFERSHRDVDGVDLGVVVKRGDAAKAQYALAEGAALLHYYNAYFGVRYPLPKLDLIAAPGQIEGGSMENWGAIFFSQDHVLFDPASSTERERQQVFQVVAHEMAHQWFGDLVTMDWWDNLWLNEGFARWMQTTAADVLHPEWKTSLRATNVFESGKRADAQGATHPVLQRVESAEQAAQAFDDITYNKGAAVITMLEDYVGPERFREGVRRYMAAHAYGNSVDSDLWSQIESASGKPVVEIEHDFTLQPGVPLIRVERDGDGCRLVQARFTEDPQADVPALSWRIPLAVTGPAGEPARIVLRGTARIPGTQPLVNAGAMAYARVAYPAPVAAGLAQNIGHLAPVDQINLLNDAWALGQSGYAPAGNLMRFLARLPADADPLVWNRAVQLLDAIDRAYSEGPERLAFRRESRRILAPLARTLATPRAGEPANRITLRGEVLKAQARFGDAAVLRYARRMHETRAGSVAEQRVALEIVAGAADAATFDALLGQVRATADPQEKAHLLEAMAEVRDPALSARMVDIALGPDAPAGSAGGLLVAAGSENPDAVWEALRPWLNKGVLPMDQASRWTVIPLIAGQSADPARIAEIRRFGERDMPTDARRPVEAAAGAIGLNARVRTAALPDITAWAVARESH